MRTLRVVHVVSLCAVIAWAAVPAHGQSTTPTLGSFLGIGADQQSSNPAIQAAAKAKAAKHQICKKKKALQYLAGMGCSPEHPEVGEALLAAMSDPDEPVRYEAVKAVLQTAGECQSPEQKKETRKALGCCESMCDAKKKFEKHICDCLERLCGKAPPKEHKKLKDMVKGKQDPACDPKADCPQGNGKGPCCSPDMRAKLMLLAYGRDEKGCFVESSSRVRTVAEQALKACNACNGCNCDPAPNRGGTGVRELPPTESRETADFGGMFPAGDGKPGPCGVSDRALPMDAYPVPLPEAEPLPVAPEPPPAERIPTPAPDCDPLVMPEQALRSVLRPSPERLASRPPAGGEVRSQEAAALPPRPEMPATPPAAAPGPVLRWPTVEEALGDPTTNEPWLPAETRIDPREEFLSVVGGSVARRNGPAPAPAECEGEATARDPCPPPRHHARSITERPAERLACAPVAGLRGGGAVLPPRRGAASGQAPRMAAASPPPAPHRRAAAPAAGAAEPLAMPAPAAESGRGVAPSPGAASLAVTRSRAPALGAALIAGGGCLLALLASAVSGAFPGRRPRAGAARTGCYPARACPRGRRNPTRLPAATDHALSRRP